MAKDRMVQVRSSLRWLLIDASIKGQGYEKDIVLDFSYFSQRSYIESAT